MLNGNELIFFVWSFQIIASSPIFNFKKDVLDHYANPHYLISHLKFNFQTYIRYFFPLDFAQMPRTLSQHYPNFYLPE